MALSEALVVEADGDAGPLFVSGEALKDSEEAAWVLLLELR